MKKYILSVVMLLATISLAAQENTKVVTGRVVDAATGQPLAGVIVSAYGNQRRTTMTDETGYYELSVPEETRSVIMRVEGYNLQQRAIADGKANAQLYSNAFSETYQTQTTAVLSSQAGQFDNTSEFSIDPLITQRLGGDVRSVNRSGIPGMGNIMLVEGINSLNANAQPLIVIDDVIMDMQYSREMLHDGYYNNLLANINVNDIETVTVLKNGTALYGAKGANGVIAIKTKRNKSMATKIDVTINGRYELVPRLPQMMNADSYRLYATELLNGTMDPNMIGKMKFLNNEPTYFYYNQYHNNTDWTDEVYKNAFSQNYGINVQGGDDAASYNLSVGYSLGNSTLRENDYSRFSMRLNSDINITKDLSVRFDASYSDVDRDLRDDGASADPLGTVITSPGFLALAKSPFLSPYAYDLYGNRSHYLAEADDYLEGKFQGRGRLANPVSILEYGDGKNRNSFGNRLVNFAITPKYQFNRHLSVSEHFVLGLVNTNENYYLPIQGVPTFVVDGLSDDTSLNNIAQSQTARETAIQSDTRITWEIDPTITSHLKVMGGVRYLSTDYTQTAQGGYNSPNDKKPNMTTSLVFKTTGGADDQTREITWYALADYNYAQKLYVTAGLSAMASSRFGKDAVGLKALGTVWGIFPSLQASYVISNENWLAKVKGIDYLRFNAGIDITGNDDIDYTASRTYFIAKTMLTEEVNTKSLGNVGNSNLKWETTRRVNLGFEGNFIDNRLHVNFNWFSSWTSGLVALRHLAWTSGLDVNYANGGKLKNTGYNLDMSYRMLNTKDWHWELGASVGHYKNKVTEIGTDNKSILTDICNGTIITAVGNPVGMFYGYKTDGVLSTAAQAQAANLGYLDNAGKKIAYEAGDMKFVDRDNDGIISEADRVIIGDPNPDIYGNIYTRLNWKHWTLDAALTYSLGNDIYNYERSILESGRYFYNQTTAMNNRWTTEGQVTDIPRVSYRDAQGNARFSDRWIEDGSYLRLSNVTINYSIPISNTYIQGITVWGAAYNIFTLTHYLGSNPDCSMSSNVLYQGIDCGLLSSGRSFAMGVKINL